MVRTAVVVDQKVSEPSPDGHLATPALVNQYLFFPLNPDKQHKKLRKLACRAQECLTREEAQKILRKADKAHRKLSQG